MLHTNIFVRMILTPTKTGVHGNRTRSTMLRSGTEAECVTISDTKKHLYPKKTRKIKTDSLVLLPPIKEKKKKTRNTSINPRQISIENRNWYQSS